MMLNNLKLLFFTGLCFFFIISAGYTDTVSSDNTGSQGHLIKGVIKKGSTASSLLKKYIPLKTIYRISSKSKNIYPLHRIKKGQPYTIWVESDRLIKFEYEIDEQQRLVVQKDGDDYNLSIQPVHYDVKLEYISATINYSLNNAIREIGEKAELASRLADIFAWDIDFIRDIQPGDSFRILVEKKYKEGQLKGYGDIQAAFFTNNGTVYKAFQYTDTQGLSGYYDQEGKSLQKAFLKAPLAYYRISSRFVKKRLHPVLKTVRPHKGVDYAAPTGTPVKTVGDGKVIEAGYNKGAGNYVKVRHPNGYTTSYFHLSRFKKGLKKNRSVRQGEIIGFVGQTGYATGPHLCFRLIKNGRHIDPLSYRPPSSNPVKPDEMEQFQERSMALTQSMVLAGKLLASSLKPST